MVASKTKSVILAIAIALISVFFFAYAIQAVYPGVDYDDYCDVSDVKLDLNVQAKCLEAGGEWTDYERDSLNMEVTGWCDYYSECREEYESARDIYERNVFFANLIIGTIVFIVAFLLALESVSAGLMGGAILLIVYGTIRYWGELSDIWRTVVLGISLTILIWLGYKKLNK